MAVSSVAAGTWHKDILVGTVLVLCAWALHGHGLTLGFFFDDHNHLELCRQNGLEGLASGNRFDWNTRISHAWWAQQETGWAFFRPFTVAMRLGLLHAFGLNPFPFHVVHLTLFSLSVVLVYGLLRRCGCGVATAGIAGLFFVLNPANAFTTTWLASDGTLLVGVWLLVGLWLLHASAHTGHRRPALLAAVFLCYALAMLSRENGIMVGPLLVLFDLLALNRPVASADAGTAVPQPTWRRRFAIYAVVTTLGVMYLPFRAWCLGDVPLPRSPYYHWPTERGFLDWLPFKMLNELVCLPLGLPFVPIVDVSWWQGRPLTSALAVVVVTALATAIMVPLRRSRAAWGVLAGIVLAQAPTQLAFSAPYNYYAATAGWAVLLALWAQRVVATRPRLVRTAGIVLAAWYLVGLWAGSWSLHGAAMAERLVRADVLASGPAHYPERTKLFFINMPFFAAEVGPAVRNAVDRSDLEVFPLTYAPELAFPNTAVLVTQEDNHTLLLRAQSNAFFAGALGEQVELGWYGTCRRDLPVGPAKLQAAAGPMPFRVEIVEADGHGIWALRFVFERSLNDSGYRFFLASPESLAQELHFDRERSEATWGQVPPRSELLDRDFNRLRRMQMACNRGLNLLARWPF